MPFFSLLNLKHLAFVTLHLHGPDRTTVPRARSTALPPLQRIKTGPQSPEHTALPPLQRIKTGPQSPEHTALPPLQRIKMGPQSPEHVLQLCPLFREAKMQQWPLEATWQEQLRQPEDPLEDQNLHPNHHTDHLRQNQAQIQS